MVLNTEAFGGAGSVLGDLLRNLKQFTARVQFEEHCPTVVVGVVAAPLAFRRFFGLRGFASWAVQWH